MCSSSFSNHPRATGTSSYQSVTLIILKYHDIDGSRVVGHTDAIGFGPMLNVVEANSSRETSTQDPEGGQCYEIVDPATEELERKQGDDEGSDQHVEELEEAVVSGTV